jgi:protease I
MTAPLHEKTVAFLVAQEGIEEVELTQPWEAVRYAGGTPELIAPAEGEVQAFNHLEKGSRFRVDRSLEDAAGEDYDAIVLPGGVANPDQLRTDERALGFLRQMAAEGKPIAVICHGPWTLVEADLVRGRTLTSWPSLKTDIRNAGGHWVDEELVVDDTLISSRKPDDLPAFCAALVERLASPGTAREAAATAAAGSATQQH